MVLYLHPLGCLVPSTLFSTYPSPAHATVVITNRQECLDEAPHHQEVKRVGQHVHGEEPGQCRSRPVSRLGYVSHLWSTYAYQPLLHSEFTQQLFSAPVLLHSCSSSCSPIFGYSAGAYTHTTCTKTVQMNKGGLVSSLI